MRFRHRPLKLLPTTNTRPKSPHIRRHQRPHARAPTPDGIHSGPVSRPHEHHQVGQPIRQFVVDRSRHTAFASFHRHQTVQQIAQEPSLNSYNGGH